MQSLGCRLCVGGPECAACASSRRSRPSKHRLSSGRSLLEPGRLVSESLFVKEKTPVLALPIMAPWTTELGVAEFARRMSPGGLSLYTMAMPRISFLNSATKTSRNTLQRTMLYSNR